MDDMEYMYAALWSIGWLVGTAMDDMEYMYAALWSIDGWLGQLWMTWNICMQHYGALMVGWDSYG